LTRTHASFARLFNASIRQCPYWKHAARAELGGAQWRPKPERAGWPVNGGSYRRGHRLRSATPRWTPTHLWRNGPGNGRRSAAFNVTLNACGGICHPSKPDITRQKYNSSEYVLLADRIIYQPLGVMFVNFTTAHRLRAPVVGRMGRRTRQWRSMYLK
jgi:hypothetical protein